jgi:hypothetical protein
LRPILVVLVAVGMLLGSAVYGYVYGGRAVVIGSRDKGGKDITEECVGVAKGSGNSAPSSLSALSSLVRSTMGCRQSLLMLDDLAISWSTQGCKRLHDVGHVQDEIGLTRDSLTSFPSVLEASNTSMRLTVIVALSGLRPAIKRAPRILASGGFSVVWRHTLTQERKATVFVTTALNMIICTSDIASYDVVSQLYM